MITLNGDFDISETFREKIRKSKNEEFNNIDVCKVEEIINQILIIDWITHISEDIYNIYLGHNIISVNFDELVKIIRVAPHLYYSKEQDLFFNIKFIRVFFYENEKHNQKKLCFFINKINDIVKIKTDYSNIDEFFNDINLVNNVNLSFSDFERIEIKDKYKNIRYIKKKMFLNEYKNLYTEYKFSLVAVLSSFLLYFIPFFPFLKMNNAMILLSIVLSLFVSISLFVNYFNIKKKMKSLK